MKIKLYFFGKSREITEREKELAKSASRLRLRRGQTERGVRASLRPGSPAVNAGLDIPWLTVDLEGNPRPQGSKYDLGAFEGVRGEVYLPLVVRNC